MPEFKYKSRDYSLEVEVVCKSTDDAYPNQAYLREAINKLIQALENWDEVYVSVKSIPAPTFENSDM